MHMSSTGSALEDYTMSQGSKPRKPRGKPFTKGKSGNPAGRAPGTPNKVTTEVKALAAELLDRPLYRAWLCTNLDDGTLPPELQKMLWHYRYGAPTKTVDLGESTVSLLDLLRGIDKEPIE